MIAAYPDLNGFVGDPDVPATTPAEDADEARRVAQDVADALAGELDRHDGDAGDDAAALLDIAARIIALHEEAVALMGRKRRLIRDARGLPLGLVSQ